MTDPSRMIRKTGTTFRRVSPAEVALAQNLEARMGDKVSVDQLAEKSGVGRMTIYEMLYDGADKTRRKYDTGIGKVDAVARELGLEAWSLLLPLGSEELLEIIAVFNSTDETGKELIRNGVAGAKQRAVAQSGIPKDGKASG